MLRKSRNYLNPIVALAFLLCLSSISSAKTVQHRRSRKTKTQTKITATKINSAPPEITPEAFKINQAKNKDALKLFEAAYTLSHHKLRYAGHWRPPGERSVWVMDCSNTSRYLYRTAAGIELPRTASAQYDALKAHNRIWSVPNDDSRHPEKLEAFLDSHLKPGDLLFWENTYRPVRKSSVTHVMIYLGRDPQGHPMMAGSEKRNGVSIYKFNPHRSYGGYHDWIGMVRHRGHFLAYGRAL